MTKPESLEILLLGPLEARLDGLPLELGGTRPRALLANLALHVGEVVSVDRIVDDLWGEEPPRTATHGVEVYVSQLRRRLGPVIITRPPGYMLELGPERIDTARFAAGAAEGRSLLEHDPLSAASTLREALSLWRGPALADFTFEPFAQVPIAGLEELRQECLEDRIAADLAAGRHAGLIPELEALVRAEPRRERLREQLMLALYRTGRAPDALAVYRDTRTMLVDELGIEPGPRLRALETAILRQDESLLSLPPPTPAGRTARRKLATVVAAELPEAGPELDAEAMYERLLRWHELAESVVGRHGGRIETIDADSLVAVFGVPVAREDDVLRAARAALDLRNGGLPLKIGVETGEVASGDAFVAGVVLKSARKLAAQAEPNDIVVGEHAAPLLAHAARFAPETTRLLEMRDDAPTFERRLDAPLIGRNEELVMLRAELEQAIASTACRAVQVIGPPGIGKTRLARELADLARGEALVLTGACAADGGSTYRPLLRIVEEAAGAVSREAILARTQDDAAASTLATALGAEEGTASAAEVAWAFRRLCNALAAERPLVLVLDDVHWAEPTLLELVERLARHGRGPMLVLCLAREELVDEHPTFLAAAERLVLDALSEEETLALLRPLLGDRLFPQALLDRVLEAGEGNPLFLEQLVAFVAEEGAPVGRPLPPTIQALLAARLDRLGPGERSVVSSAAVVGREFHLGELTALLERSGAETAERHLRKLAASGFVRAAGDAFRFRHVLVQEAAYRTVALSERAELHERLADHLARVGETDELVGFHLERAFRLRAELGEDERRVRQLAADAGARLGAAGIQAWKRNDVPATVGLLERATNALDGGTPAHELLCELGLAVLAAGDARRADRLLSQVARDSSPVGLRARFELEFIHLLETPGTTAQTLLDLTQSAVPAFDALYDDRALGRIWLLTAFVQTGRYLHCKAGEEAAGRAVFHYKRAGWPAATSLAQLASALYLGPTPAGEAAARCEALLADRGLGPAGEANVLVCLGGLFAMLGRLDDGRALVARARRTFEELGQLGFSAAACGEVSAAIEVLSGDFAAAERILSASCDVLERARLTSTFATAAGALAGVIYAQGRYDEADAWTVRAEEAGAADDLDARLAWQPVRAKILARRGEHAAADRVARAVATAVLATDALNRRAWVQLDLAEMRRLIGDEREASRLVANAREDFTAKENVPALERLASAAAV